MPVHISIWSDIVCPWCYVGKRRLETALATYQERRGKAADVSIEYKAFELDQRRTGESDDKYVERLASKYGVPASQAQGMIHRMTSTGKEEGIEFRFDRAVPANTFDAHRLLLLARLLDENDKTDGEQQKRLKERLMHAHFEEGADLNDAETLLALATESGIDTDKAAAVLASDDFGDDVRDDEDEAQMLGVTGVPFFAIGRFGVQGAQRAETLLEVIERALADESSEEAALSGDGDVCLPDEC